MRPRWRWQDAASYLFRASNSKRDQLSRWFLVCLLCYILLVLRDEEEAVASRHATRSAQFVRSTAQPNKPTVRVAIVADTTLFPSTERVFQLIRDEQADMVLHQGDIDYTGFVDKFDRQVDEILGDDIPLFYTKGNYEAKSRRGKRSKSATIPAPADGAPLGRTDFQQGSANDQQFSINDQHGSIFVPQGSINNLDLGATASPSPNTLESDGKRESEEVWMLYVDRRNRRLKKAGASCVHESRKGDIACHYKGVSFVLSTITVDQETVGSDLAFLQQSLARLQLFDKHPPTKFLRGAGPQNDLVSWKFCSWHAPLYLTQLGFRDPVGVMKSDGLLEACNSCRRHGAIIVTGHEHYYTRTHTIYDFARPVKYGMHVPSKRVQEHTKAHEMVHVGPGETFAVVSGLGGHSVSVPSKTLLQERSHIAAVHPKYMLTDVDPMGKVFYGNFTGKAATSSRRLQSSSTGAQGYPFGALFCDLVVNGRNGTCYFKTIENKVVDRFLIVRPFVD